MNAEGKIFEHSLSSGLRLLICAIGLGICLIAVFPSIFTVRAQQDTYTLTVISDHGPVTKDPDQETYTYGTEVLLTMGTVDPGWTFTGWEGGGCTGTAPCTVTMTADTTITANFTQDAYTLTVISDHGTVSALPDQPTYIYGTEVLLSMGTVDPGWTFTGWSGGGCTGTAPCTVTMTANTTITANFSQDAYILTVISAHGTVSIVPDQPTYTYGTEVLLSMGTVDPGWTFTGWSGGGCTGTAPCTVTMTADTTITANFSQDAYILTVISAHGTVSIVPDQPTYTYGTEVLLTMGTVDPGWTFTGWSGGGCAGTDPCTVTMYSDTIVTANFYGYEYQLTVDVSPAEGGSVLINPAGPYHLNDLVTLTPQAATGWLFQDWGGRNSNDLINNLDGTWGLVMDEDKTVKANFSQITYLLTVSKEGTGSGTVTSNPVGIDCGLDCSEAYIYSTLVGLSASANAGSTFTGWEGGGCTGTGPCSVIMNTDTTVTANFTQDAYTLTVISDHGAVSRVPDQPTYTYGTEVLLSMGTVDPGWTFTGWSGGGCTGTAPCIVTMTADITVTANFTQDVYTLTVISDHGTASIVPDQPTYTYGTEVLLTMGTVDPGWTFTGWEGGGCAGTDPCTVTMNADTTVTANFIQDAYTLTVISDHGTVSIVPDQPTYTYGTEVLLTMGTVDPGWTFTGWSGGGCTGTDPCAMTMTADTTVIANFSQDLYTLTVISAHGTVSIVPDQPTYTYGTEVLLTMGTVNPGWTFTGWEGGGCTGTDPCTVTMYADITVTANFSQDAYTLTVNKTGNGSGTVTSTPTGIDCGLDCSENYTYNTSVMLNAQAAAGSTFTGWSDACTGIDICQVTMVEARNVTARFTQNTIIIADAVVQEGDSETLGMNFTLRTSVPASVPISVHYATNAGSALPDLDYETATGTVVFEPGDQAETITLNVRGDLLDEEDETFYVVLSDPVGAIILDGIGMGTILDGDDPPNMTIVPSIDLFEGTSVAVNAVFTLTLSTASGKTVSVNFETEDDTATGGNTITQGTDYLRMSSQVVFSPGEIIKRVWVPVNSDDECETQETFYLNLSNVENANLLLDRSEATIKNDDLCLIFLPAIINYEMIYADNFDSDMGWEEVPEFRSEWFILNGEYHGKHEIADRNAKAVAPVTSTQLDGSYSVEVNVGSEDGSYNDGRGGLLFDYINNNATNRFVIIPCATSGENWFVQVRNTRLSQWDTLGSGRDDVHINSGNSVNRLRVERIGPQIRAYVNGYLLWSGSDNTFTLGQVGLNIGAPAGLPPGNYIEFSFDNFIIGNLP
jgi:uncharacterized repeat protein (TIGR02543 family)